MITKERLEELIEQGADIWVLYENKIYPHKAKDVVINGFNCVSIGFDFNHLFETKEDAEEYAEFGNITRTEKLPYVFWEKFKNKEGNYSFKVYPYDYYCYTDGRYVRIKQYYGSLDRIVFAKPLTRENYNEARRLCVKLFKGEEV